jgi:hypothetical protein
MGVRTENVERPEEFSQVCIWQHCTLGGMEGEFAEVMLDTFNLRVFFLEEIETRPTSENPEGRTDLLFAIHNDDVLPFSMLGLDEDMMTPLRLKLGIRWVDDVLSLANGGGREYPNRVFGYRGKPVRAGG